MSHIPEDTMRRALLLAEWAKAHQAQCWSFFQPELGAKQADPVERAIMQVIVDEADRIEADMLKISNRELLDLVKKKLGMSGLSAVTVGKAASALGLIKAKWAQGSIRGWTVPRDKINSFKSTVPTVPTVPSPCESNEIFGDSVEKDLPPSVPADSSTPEAVDSGERTKNALSPDGSIEAIGPGTVGTALPEQNFENDPSSGAPAGFPTEPTVAADDSFDFYDPAFPAVVTI
jgi:hypothetical protein